MRRPHDVNKAYSLLVNREIACLMLREPRLLDEARREHAMMTAPQQRDAAERWSALLSQPLDEIAAALSRDDEDGDYVRETRPPFIVLDPQTRMRLWAEARSLIVDAS